jgi:hypothetical protein
MKSKGLLGAAALWLCWTGLGHAQAIPSVPTAPAAPVAPAAPAQPVTVWNKLGITKENCDACKDRCCKSPLGQLLNNMTKPLTFATGGLVGPLCPPNPTDAELKKLLDPDSTASEAEKTAAKIKASEAQAAARRAAIRYLGTVDCHYFPEAQDALISGLRGDTNECVRFEAALALSKGCCCTKKTVDALLLVVNGESSDGNPSETSERVKAMASVALQHCMGHVGEQPGREQPPEIPPEPPSPPEKAEIGKRPTPGVQLAGYTAAQGQRPPTATMIDQACRALAESVSTSPATRTLPTGQRSVSGILASLSGPVSVREDNAAFEEAVLASQAARPTSPPPQPAPAPVQRAEAPRPVMLTAPAALLVPGP